MPGDPNQPREPNEMDRRLDEVRSEAKGRRLLDDAEIVRRANALEAQLSNREAAIQHDGLNPPTMPHHYDLVVASELSRAASKVHTVVLDLGRILSHATLTPSERAYIVSAQSELNTVLLTFRHARGFPS
jgi:hypothetical protein